MVLLYSFVQRRKSFVYPLLLPCSKSCCWSYHCTVEGLSKYPFEITKLVKSYPKRNILFDQIRSECEEKSGIGIHTFCPTGWTFRGDSIENVLVNYNALKLLWEECLTTSLQPDFMGRIIGVRSQLSYVARYGTKNLFYFNVTIISIVTLVCTVVTT